MRFRQAAISFIIDRPNVPWGASGLGRRNGP
jgi:hypothetical protein